MSIGRHANLIIQARILSSAQRAILSPMCNLYSITKGQAAIRELARAIRDRTGNLRPLPGVFPDYAAPIVRTAPDGVRELAMARWGMPSPAFALKGKKTDPGVTNVRNTKSAHWRRWLDPDNRCLVPLRRSASRSRSPTVNVHPHGLRWVRTGRWRSSPGSGSEGGNPSAK